MSTICADQQHKFHFSHHLMKKPTIEIPPRRLLAQKLLESPTTPHHHHQFPFELANKYLPHNNNNEDNYDSSDIDENPNPCATDHFRMYEFKIRRCTRSRSHDWTDCPFAHTGEKARRRDPRLFHYAGTVCSEFQRDGSCSRGDDCEFSHGVFECWLHPSRYRTEACKDGKDCKRKVCFFAHTPHQLRILPEMLISGSNLSSPMNNLKINNKGISCCCLLCQSVSESPTSTLLGLSHLSRSPSLSPPFSPVNKQRSAGITLSGFSPISRYSDRLSMYGGAVSYKDMFNELTNSLESMNFTDSSSSSSLMSISGGNSNNNNNNGNINVHRRDVNCFNGDHHQDFQQEQQQFVLSPSTSNPINGHGYSFSNGDFSSNFVNSGGFGYHEKSTNVSGLATSDHPDRDLGWVNDLLT